MPRRLAGLGLDPAALRLHVAYDIGAAALTRRLAALLEAPAVLSHFSRLVIDPNRVLDHETSIPEVSDGIAVPGNRALSGGERRRRVAIFFAPYHRALAAALQRRLERGRLPALVSVHSFTPVMEGLSRPWEIGVLWNRDGRLALPLIEALRARGLVVGDNQPYSGATPFGYTMQHHADPLGLPQVLLEVRQDLIDTQPGVETWARRLAEVLPPLLDDPALRHPYAV